MNPSLWKTWIDAARTGEPVWLADLTEAARRLPDSLSLHFFLTHLDGCQQDFPISLPRWEGEASAAMAREAACAFAYNLLAVYSGQALAVCYEPGSKQGRQLAESVCAAFRRPGYAKPIREAGRLNAAGTGGSFRLTLREWDGSTPPPPQPPSARPLGPLLRQAAERAEQGFRCGIDVGGTDIKLAVSRGGELLQTLEYDWNPAACETAEALLAPILSLVENAAAGGRFDAIGVSFPDVVIRDRILGGETPKTRGLRQAFGACYDTEFHKLTILNERLTAFCRGPVRIINDGSMAAFTAAVELVFQGREAEIAGGVAAHSLGTDLGTGWLRSDGAVPPIPLELYDLLLDLGSLPQRGYAPEDLRSVCNENSGLPGVRRYLGQAAAYRLAAERKPSLLAGFAEDGNGLLRIPADKRKPCLAHLMRLARDGDADAREIFRRIGVYLGQLSRFWLLLGAPQTPLRFLYGRFLQEGSCLQLMREGFAQVCPALRLEAGDESLACSPLMRRLAARPGVSVAQFGQAVGAIIYASMEERS